MEGNNLAPFSPPIPNGKLSSLNNNNGIIEIFNSSVTSITSLSPYFAFITDGADTSTPTTRLQLQIPPCCDIYPADNSYHARSELGHDQTFDPSSDYMSFSAMVSVEYITNATSLADNNSIACSYSTHNTTTSKYGHGCAIDLTQLRCPSNGVHSTLSPSQTMVTGDGYVFSSVMYGTAGATAALANDAGVPLQLSFPTGPFPLSVVSNTTHVVTTIVYGSTSYFYAMPINTAWFNSTTRVQFRIGGYTFEGGVSSCP